MAVTAQQSSAVFTLTSSSGYRAVFNDPLDMDYIGGLEGDDAVTGLDSPEVRAAVFAKVEADGSIFGNFYHGERPVTVQGSILADTVTARNIREDKLYKVINDCMRTTGTLGWTPSGSVAQQVYVRKHQPLRVKGGFKKDFMLSLIAADPYIYSTTLNSIGPTAPATNQTVNNQGNAAREPWNITVTGPTNGTVWLRSVFGATTREIRMLSTMPNLAAGETLVFDFLNRTVYHYNSGATIRTDYYRYFDYANSSWWLLYPGNNTVSLRGTNTTGTITTQWRETWV